MSLAKVTTDQIGTEKIEIFVDASGQFHAEYNDESFNADTRAGLLDLLSKAVKSKEKETAIPVTFIDLVPSTKNSGWGDDKYTTGRGIMHAKLRGKHARESNTYLFVSDDGKTKFKMGRYNGLNKLCRRLTPEEIAEYTRLAKEVDFAEANMDGWLATVHVDAKDVLKLD